MGRLERDRRLLGNRTLGFRWADLSRGGRGETCWCLCVLKGRGGTYERRVLRVRGRGREFDGVAGIGRLSSSGDGRGERLRCRCSDHQLRRDGKSKCLLGGGDKSQE